MATTKKKVTKKAPAKAPVKKKTPSVSKSRKVSKKSATKGEMQSFHVSTNNPPFTTFRITRQTAYWVILVAFIIFVQLWIISLQVEVASLLDAQQAQFDNY